MTVTLSGSALDHLLQDIQHSPTVLVLQGGTLTFGVGAAAVAWADDKLCFSTTSVLGRHGNMPRAEVEGFNSTIDLLKAKEAVGDSSNALLRQVLSPAGGAGGPVGFLRDLHKPECRC